MEFGSFAERAAEIAAESGDLATVSLVADLLRDAEADLPVVARFVQGRVFPAWESTTLDVGPALCYEALARAAGRNVSPGDIEDRLADVGDIGDVAASLDLGRQRGLDAFGAGGKEETRTVADVAAGLREVAEAEGKGSEATKRDLLFGLFNRSSPEEARFLARLVLSEMRIGVGEGTVRDAIAEAFDVPEAAVERALQVTNDYGRVAQLAREEGRAGLKSVELSVGRPIQAMLAQTGTVEDAFEAWGEAAVEVKFDGARVQLHFDGADVRLFSRNMSEVTDALPEVVEHAEAHLEAPAIVDGEVVAVDDDGEPLAFQEVLRRFRRKHDVGRMRERVRLELHAFDCLHADGVDLLEEPLLERHDRLRELLPESTVSSLWRTDDTDDIADIEARALADGHEGVMLKNPSSTYTPGARGRDWLKRKPEVETLDLVVTGAEWGEGRRANFLGTFLLSARTEDGYATVGKVATGITDEQLADLTDLLEPHIREQDGREVDIRPAVVLEVGYEEIQPSPTYGSGYALRFPRLVGVREDKSPDDADSVERVRRLADGEGG